MALGCHMPVPHVSESSSSNNGTLKTRGGLSVVKARPWYGSLAAWHLVALIICFRAMGHTHVVRLHARGDHPCYRLTTLL